MKKMKKMSTNFKPTDNSNVINKGYPDEKLEKIHCHLSFLGKD